ncbi:MAG: toll/interleukin-1 receptor domain-containing protein [Candidatus Binatia bacterium]
MSGVFISYRREDSGGKVERLCQAFRKYLPGLDVFRDIRGLKASEDWIHRIRNEIDESAVVLAVIGKKWLVVDDRGVRRISDPEDILQREISWALKKQREIIPVLVSGATMPRKRDLPDQLKKLHRLQAYRIRDAYFAKDVQELSSRIREIIEEKREKEITPEEAEAVLDEIDEAVGEGGRLELLPGVYADNFSVAGRWKCEIKSPMGSDPPWFGRSGGATLEFYIPISGGTFEGVWRGARKLSIEGKWMLDMDPSQNHRIIGLLLRGVADSVEPFDWEIPIEEEVGNGYRGTDRSGRSYFLRLLEEPEF